MPIYQVIKHSSPAECILVDANNKAQAIHHVSKDMFDAVVLTPREIVKLMTEGAKVAKVTPIVVQKKEDQIDLPNVATEATE